MTQPVRIPADVDRPDRLLGNLTGRQLVILAAVAAALYVAWIAARTVVPPLVFLTAAAPIAAAAATLALGSRDGISLDRLALAAVRQRVAPVHRVTAPEGVHPVPAWIAATGGAAGTDGGPVSPVPLRLPARGVHLAGTGNAGVIDLGGDGLAVVAVCSTVNFALRTPAEQQSLVSVFGRWLHSLAGGAQILIRAERLDLSGQIADLRDRAPGLPHPALEAAAVEHADYLAGLAGTTDLLRRQVLLVLRDPLPGDGASTGAGPAGLAALTGRRRRTGRDHGGNSDAARWAGETRLTRRLSEAAELLAPAGVTVTGLDPAQATAVLAAACNPDTLLPPGSILAAADEVITTGPGHGTGGDGGTGGSDYPGDAGWSDPGGTADRGRLAGLFGNGAPDSDGNSAYDDEDSGREDSDRWQGRWAA